MKLRMLDVAILAALSLQTILATADCFPVDQQVEAADGYKAQQAACIAQYADKASIDACRARVEAAWAPDASPDASLDATKDGAK